MIARKYVVIAGCVVATLASSFTYQPAQWAPFVEPGFPFFSSALDARTLGAGWPPDNLTPRGLILNLGHDAWACFDTDLLRVSAIWTGSGVTPVSMSQISYHLFGEKAPEGQGALPRIAGTPWIANGIYAGWQTDEPLAFTDPRPPGPDPKEVGRGPIDPAIGRFKAIRLTATGARLEYDVAGASVQETIVARPEGGQTIVERRFRVAGLTRAAWLVLGRRPSSAGPLSLAVVSSRVQGQPAAVRADQPGDVLAVSVRPSPGVIEFQVILSVKGDPIARQAMSTPPFDALPSIRWPQAVVTTGALSTSQDAYVVDRIPIPAGNPWRRNVRLADLAFYDDGRAAAVTFDGDVWIISGLGGDLKEVRWRRFTSGLHEPLGIAIRRGDLFVFDRNGIWRLHDTDGNGEADVHELFSNVFAQTAETREFATGMRVAPDDSFLIAKGGQVGTTVGPSNGAILRVSADGRTSSVVGYGLRQPFVAVHPKTGFVTASDQQGNYVPATPIHVVRDRQYYGFIPLTLPKEQYPAPIADPLLWIPHAISASAASQTWLVDAKMGPLNDTMIQIDYYRPELLAILLNRRASRLQAAAVSLTRNFDFAPLEGAVNPADGQLYVAGFQIWGTEAKEISGLARYRYTGAPSTVPREVAAMKDGVLLRFEVPLDRQAAIDPANYSAERWNYKRTAEYGSPHFKLDGTEGQDAMTPSSAYLSRDGQSVFIGIPDMQPVMQMRVAWTLKTRSGAAFSQNGYLTAYELTQFDPAAEGFEPIDVVLTPRANRTASAAPRTAEEGRRIATLMGCAGCHSADGTSSGKVGPSWKGLYGSERQFVDGTKAIADEAYLRQSIREPAVRVVKGFDKSDTGMPPYAGVLTSEQIEAVIQYIKSLK